MNPEFIRGRSEVIKLVRRFFDERGYLELHTPRMVGLPGQEPYLEPFWSKLRTQNSELRTSLITSPEYAMKRMLAAGFDKIYDLGPCFRNGEPWDGTHDPEFMMIEWYRRVKSPASDHAARHGGLDELMDETEEMTCSILKGLPKFRRITVEQAMKEYAGVELGALLGDREAMAEECRKHNQTVNEGETWDDLFFKIFLSEVEPKLGEVPTFLWRYPASMAALAQRDPDDTRYALRVELYVEHLELANGFVELADPIEQRARFVEDQALRKSLGKETWPIDERFMEALPKMGQAAGIAFGVDRLAMLVTGAKSISDLMPIPVRERF